MKAPALMELRLLSPGTYICTLVMVYRNIYQYFVMVFWWWSCLSKRHEWVWNQQLLLFPVSGTLFSLVFPWLSFSHCSSVSSTVHLLWLTFSDCPIWSCQPSQLSLYQITLFCFLWNTQLNWFIYLSLCILSSLVLEYKLHESKQMPGVACSLLNPQWLVNCLWYMPNKQMDLGVVVL